MTRDRRVLAWAAVATVPFLLLGVLSLASTLRAVADPCTTWGTSWDSYQRGGGTASYGPDGAPADPACPNGRRWTTQAPGHAVFRTAWWPAFGAAAAVLAGTAWWRSRAWPLAGAAALLAAGALPLTISAPVFVAFLPAAAALAAARLLPWTEAERAAFRTFGALAAAIGVAGLVSAAWGVVAGRVPAFALIGVVAVLAQLALLAVLAFAPPRTAPDHGRGV